MWPLLEALSALSRKAARRRAEGDESKAVITSATVAADLGAPTFVESDVPARTRAPGIAVGLAWTPYGGDVLFVEAGRMSGTGGLVLTGPLGYVMRESARTAVSLVRAHAVRCSVDGVDFRAIDLHVHVQSAGGSTDGTSAGVAVAGRSVLGPRDQSWRLPAMMITRSPLFMANPR